MVHTGGGRRRGKSRPRILYWFRTPPGVRIGRSALDEAAIRLIEEHNPDVEFDWTRILKGQDAPEQKPAQHAPQDRRGRPRREFSPRQEPVRPAAAHVASRPEVESGAAETAEPLPETAQIEAPEPTTVAADATAPGSAAAQPAPGVSAPPPEVQPRLDEAAIADLLADSTAPLTIAAGADEPASPAQARLGSEGLSRLRARHAEVLARISETVTDPVRRDELKSQAERLNPDTWVTDAEVSQGLESYETVFESLRTVVGRGRKRRRRSGGRSKGLPGSAVPAQQDGASPDSAGGDEDDAQDAGDDL